MAESPALVAGVDDVRAVGEAVDDGLREPGVGEHFCPFPERQVGRDDQAAAFVSFGEHLEDELGGTVGQREISQFVAEEQLDCEFQRVPAYLHVSVDGFSKKDISLLKRDAELASEFGFDSTYLKRGPYFNLLGVRFANQAKFHLAGANPTADGSKG